jgi:hypothetical protein
MKKARLILASAACMVAIVGVYAKAIAVAPIFYVPSYVHRNQTGVFCTIVVSSPAFCGGSFTIRCTIPYTYNGTVFYNVNVSKRAAEGGLCEAVFRF